MEDGHEGSIPDPGGGPVGVVRGDRDSSVHSGRELPTDPPPYRDPLTRALDRAERIARALVHTDTPISEPAAVTITVTLPFGFSFTVTEPIYGAECITRTGDHPKGR